MLSLIGNVPIPASDIFLLAGDDLLLSLRLYGIHRPQRGGSQCDHHEDQGRKDPLFAFQLPFDFVQQAAVVVMAMMMVMLALLIMVMAMMMMRMLSGVFFVLMLAHF